MIGNLQPFNELINKMKTSPKKIIFTGSTDERILEAASRLLASNFLKPILVGDEEEILGKAEKEGFNIRGAEIIDFNKFDKLDEMLDSFLEIRKGKGLTRDDARRLLAENDNYFGLMLVEMGYADALLGSQKYSMAETMVPAFKVFKTKPGHKIATSCSVLVRPYATGGDEVIVMGDCTVHITPNPEELAEIGTNMAEFGVKFGIEPHVAFLSYSTLGSGKGEDVDKMREAAAIAKKNAPEYAIDGEIQFDAAVSPVVARIKCKGSDVAGRANTFVFPDLNAGNIGYKVANRLGNFSTYGPVILGLSKPANFMTRGANADQTYVLAIITAAQSEWL